MIFYIKIKTRVSLYRKGYKMDVTHNAVVSDQLFRICGTRSSSDDAIGIAAIPAPVFLVCRNGLTLRDDAVRIAAVAASILHVGGGVEDVWMRVKLG